MKKYAIILAGGSGTRMGGEIPKQFLLLKDKPILMQTLLKFAVIKDVELILVLPDNQLIFWEDLCKKYKFSLSYTLVLGGDTRVESVKNALNYISDEKSLVAIHDGVRPLIEVKTIEKSFEKAQKDGNAITVISLKDSIRQKINKENTNETKSETKSVNRDDFYLVQTPQTFQTKSIKEAYQAKNIEHLTDDASVLENIGGKIFVIEGSYQNIKITTPEDLVIANAFFS